MGQPNKSPQLKVDLLLLTPVEILGKIFYGSVNNHCSGNLITRGAALEGRELDDSVSKVRSFKYPSSLNFNGFEHDNQDVCVEV